MVLCHGEREYAFSSRKLSALLPHNFEEGDAIAGRISEDGEPTDVGDFGFGKHCLAAERLDFGKVGVDVVAPDVDAQAVGLILGILSSAPSQLGTAAARARLLLILHILRASVR